MKENSDKAAKISIEEAEPLIKSILIRNKGLTEDQLCINLKYNGGYISQLRSREKSTGEPQVSPKFYEQLKSYSLQYANYSNNDQPPMVNEDPVKYGLKGEWGTGKDVFINALLDEKERAIKKAEENAQKMESFYQDAKSEKNRLLNQVDKLADIIDKTLKDISSNLKEAAASLAQNNQQIALLKDQTYIVSDQLEHQREALGLGLPGEKRSEPQSVPFVKKGKASSGVQHDGGKKNKGH